MARYTEKQVERVNGAIVSTFIAGFYLSECSSLGVFRQSAKTNVKRTQKDLEVIEKNFYEEIDKVDESDFSSKIISNTIEFIECVLQKYSFNDFLKIQEVCVAYDIDKHRLTSISDRILRENGAKD